MKPRFVLPGVLVIAAIVAIIAAGIAAVALATMPSLWPGRGTANARFDPLLASAVCTSPRAGPPPLLAHLVQARSPLPPAPPVQPETRPFTPGQQPDAAIPGAGHIVHMPSHIYYRLGMYREALRANLDAIAIDERYFANAASDPVYRGAYYPHNIHFVMVSALMGGDGPTAIEAASKLDKVITPELLKTIGALQPVKSSPYFAHVQFSDPDTLLALPDPGPDFVPVKAMWHYARAVGHTRNGAFDEAGREIAALEAIARGGDFKAVTDWNIPGREIVRTAHAVARARLADAQGQLPRAIAAWREAIAIQDRLPYMEPPYWYYPVRQSLGVALLRSGQPAAAEKVFRDSLARTPSNGWALRGLMEVYRVRGDQEALGATQKQFATTWLGKAEGPALSSL